MVGLEPTRNSEFSAYLLHFLNSQVTKIVTKIKKEPPSEDDDSTQKERNQNAGCHGLRLEFHKEHSYMILSPAAHVSGPTSPSVSNP